MSDGGLSSGALSEYTTRELLPETLPDFEALLDSRPGPGARPCWCMYHHMSRGHPAVSEDLTRVERLAAAQEAKRNLVAADRSHGILVYHRGEPVGWCQFGRRQDLPRIDFNPAYRRLTAGSTDVRWRITCFIVDRRHRRRGLARLALRSALESIVRRGGGGVEAFPAVRWNRSADYRGTLSMFQDDGFAVVGSLGRNLVLVRRTL